jgi:hypothetical protein
MIGCAVVLVLIAVPCWHLATAHLIFKRHAPTEHELKHRQRPMWLQLAANLAWLTYLAGTVLLGLALR